MATEVMTAPEGRIIHKTYAVLSGAAIPQRVYVTQYDESLPVIACTLYKDGQLYTIPDGASVRLRMNKNGLPVYHEAMGIDDARHVVYLEITAQMTVLYGEFAMVIEVETSDGKTAGTSYLRLIVRQNPVQNPELDNIPDYTANSNKLTAEGVKKLQDESSTQQKAIEDKGKNTLESIPADYSALSGQVNDNTSWISELKEDLVNINDTHGKEIYHDKFDVVVDNTQDGWALKGDGTRVESAGNCINSYKVVSGQKLYLKLKKYTNYVWQWQTSKYSVSTDTLIGTTKNTSFNGYIVVPDGASYLAVSTSKNDTENVIRLVESKIENLNKVNELYNPVIEYLKGKNRFDDRKDNYLENHIVENGVYKELDGYFVTPFLDVDPNTTYYKNEDANGIFYDKSLNYIGKHSGTTFTTPSNCAFYQTSASYGIRNKFYVSTENNISTFNDTPILSEDGIKAVQSAIKDDVSIKEEIHSASSEYVNTTQSTNKAVVTFIDDDGMDAVYTRLLPIVKNKNIKYGLAIVSTFIGGSSYCMTMEQLKECYATGLFEILSHTYSMNSRLTSLTEDELNYQFSNSVQWMKSNGFDCKALVYPQNDTNNLVRTTARKYFDFCFKGVQFNDKGYLDHSKIDRIAFGSYTSDNPQISGIDGKNTLEYYKACVDKAVSNGEWLVFMTHIREQTTSDDTILGDLIDYIRSIGVAILSPSEAFAVKRNQINIGDEGDKYLFVGNKNFDTNMIGYQYRVSGNKTAESPVSSFIKDTVSMYYYGYSETDGFPTKQGILEVFRCGNWSGFSWQKWTAHPTCKQYMRFWDADNNKWFDWVPLN